MEKRSQPAILNLIVVKNPYRVFYTNVLIIFMRYKLNFFLNPLIPLNSCNWIKPLGRILLILSLILIPIQKILQKTIPTKAACTRKLKQVNNMHLTVTKSFLTACCDFFQLKLFLAIAVPRALPLMIA